MRGVACEFQGATTKNRLAAYEGVKYVEKLCLIHLLGEDGTTITESVFGVVFAWIGGDDDLHHGEFDLEAYKKAKAELEAADK